MCPRTNIEAAAPRGISVDDSLSAVDQSGSWKIGAGNQFDEIGDTEFGILEQRQARVDDLAEIVRRNVGGHTDRNAGRPVDQEIRYACRQDVRLMLALVIIRREVDRLFVDVGQQILSHPSHANFGVAHSSRRIAVDGAKVALPVDEQIAHGEGLRHTDDGLVDRAIAVWMVLTDHVTDDTGRFFVRFVEVVPQFAHGIQDAAMDRFEAIADIRQRASHDYAHGIIEIRLFHLVFEIDRIDFLCEFGHVIYRKYWPLPVCDKAPGELKNAERETGRQTAVTIHFLRPDTLDKSGSKYSIIGANSTIRESLPVGLRGRQAAILRVIMRPPNRPDNPSRVSHPDLNQRIDALIFPRWTIAVEPDTSVLQDVAVAVDKGRIVELLPRGEALARYTPDATHERPGHVLLPGLINAHTHAAMSLMRGYADDMPLARWLEERIWPTEMNLVNPDFVADGTRLAVAEMLRAGTTCFADMYFFPDQVADVAADAGIRAAVGMPVLEFPSPWAAAPDEYISKGLAVHDAYRAQPLISTFFAPHAPYSVSDETFRRIRQLADELEIPVQLHVHETAQEVEDALSQSSKRPLRRLDELGLLNSALMAVHATQLTNGEIEQLALAGASVVHCPRSNLKLASGACPVARLLERGVNVALGTDGAASNNRLDLWAEMEVAALFGKHVAQDPEAIPAPVALEMATINGARALGLADEVGSVVPGKAADVICVEVTSPAVRPVLDPLSQLVYCAGREHVTDVWVAGEHLVERSALTRMEPLGVLERADQWGKRVLEA